MSIRYILRITARMASEWTVEDDDELAGVTLGTGKAGSLPGLSYLLLFLAAQLSQLGTYSCSTGLALNKYLYQGPYDEQSSSFSSFAFPPLPSFLLPACWEGKEGKKGKSQDIIFMATVATRTLPNTFSFMRKK